MAPLLEESLVSHLQANPFGFVNDGSIDTVLKKMNAMCALVFDVNRSKRVELIFYDMCATWGKMLAKHQLYLPHLKMLWIGTVFHEKMWFRWV